MLTPPTPPQYLYKYRSVEGDALTYLKRCILKNEIYFAKPSELNDPGELNFVIQASNMNAAGLAEMLKCKEVPPSKALDIAMVIEEYHGGIPEGLQDELVVRTKALFDELREGHGILSMAESPLISPMWSHYAASHSGVCLEFRVNTKQWFEFWPCQYRKGPLIWDLAAESKEDFVERWSVTKTLEWDYENEWRCFNHPGVHVYPRHLLTGVIFGSRCSNDIRRTISDWINSSSLQITIRAINHHMEFVNCE